MLAASGKAEARPGDHVDDDARDEYLARPAAAATRAATWTAMPLMSLSRSSTSPVASLASDLVESGVTTRLSRFVIAVLAASRDGESINAAAKASGMNYRTAQRIVEAAAAHAERQLAAAG